LKPTNKDYLDAACKSVDKGVDKRRRPLHKILQADSFVSKFRYFNPLPAAISVFRV
jgi:hypothetical protein